MTEVTSGTKMQQLVLDLSKVDQSASQRLAIALSALEDNEAEALARVNLHSILDPNALEARAIDAYQRVPRWLSVIEWVRNVLVLLPIALTWYGLSKASEAYSAIITQNPDLITQPFLLLWERGFPGLESRPPVTFSGLAILDFIVIAVIIFMTLLVHFWRDFWADRAERRAAQLRVQVEEAIWTLDEEFSDQLFRQNGTHDARRVVQAFQKVHTLSERLQEDIRAEREHLGSLAEKRERELGDLSLFGNGLKEETAKLLTYSQSVGQTYEQIKNVMDDSYDRLAQVVVKISEDANQAMGQISDRAEKTISSASLELTKLVNESFTELSGMVVGANKSFNNSVSQLGQQLRKLEAQQDALQKSLNATSEQAKALLEVTKAANSGLHTAALVLQNTSVENVDNAAMIVSASDKLGALAVSMLESDSILRATFVDLSDNNVKIIQQMQEVAAEIAKSKASNDTIAQAFEKSYTKLSEFSELSGKLFREIAGVAKWAQESSSRATVTVSEFLMSAEKLEQAVSQVPKYSEELMQLMINVEQQWNRLSQKLDRATASASSTRVERLLVWAGPMFAIIINAILLLFILQRLKL